MSKPPAAKKDAKGGPKEPEILPETPSPKRIEVGVYHFEDGSSYDGEIEVNKEGIKVRQGQGKYVNGVESYCGHWQQDFMHGEGEYRFASGAVYTGSFQNGLFHGEGRYQYLDGSYYQGSWHNNKMHGKGEYVDCDGTNWKGMFFNGMYDSGRTYITVRPTRGV